MIVCHCNVICTNRIKAIVEDALVELPAQAITPALVHARCGKAPNCGKCQLTIHRVIKSMVEEAATRPAAGMGSATPVGEPEPAVIAS